jgi:hypothetical protein
MSDYKGGFLDGAHAEKLAQQTRITELEEQLAAVQKDVAWQLVPINPTYQMMANALVACPVFGLSINAMYPMYTAMLAAAPIAGKAS